jgi:ribosome biogenesis GTPase
VPQVIGANLDTVLVVASLNQDFNPARIDRYLAAIAEGGAGAGLVLSKADLCDDPGALITQLSAVAAALPRAVVSAKGDLGREALQMFLEPRTTIALVGSSGVGKSSLINWLLGEERQATREIRGDERGRHATTRRELVVMPGGTLLIDTPGMRELEPWDAGEALEQVFDDLEQLAAECRFRDCAHHEEPGCAVRAAIEAGDLPPERLEQWLKLQREQRHQRAQGDPLERKRMRDEWQKKVREMGERHRLERGGGKGRRE